MENEKISILLVEDNKDFAKLLQVYLHRFEKDRFQIVWKENYTEAMAELNRNKNLDVVLMDYFLPGKNGFEISKEIIEKQFPVPIVFLTVNKDFDVVLKVMKLGVADYLVKEEISSPILPRTILNVIERARLKEHLMQIEISKHRVKVMREMLAGVLNEIETPLVNMQEVVTAFQKEFATEAQQNYLKIIQDNVTRMTAKLGKLKVLSEDKTITYIKDIRMIDLS